MTKRVISLILTVLTVLSLCVPAFAAAEPAEVSDQPKPAAVIASGSCGASGSNLKWSLSSDGTLTITGSGRMKDFSHPQYAPSSSFSAWKGWDSAPWLYYDLCEGANGAPLCQIRSVKFGKGITYIGEHAFTYSNIPSVTLPEGLTSIGPRAFGSCNKLTSVTLPSTLKTIGWDAFTGCRISKVTIPAGVTRIAGGAFGNGGASATTGGQNTVMYEQLTEVTILSKNCAIEDSGQEKNHDNYIGWDNIYTLGDPRYTVIRGYAGSTAQTFARRWGYTFKDLGTAKKGWVTEGGKKYYYQNGAKLKGLYIIGGQRYYFSARDGAMLTGIVTVDSAGHKCYFSVKDGRQLRGLRTVDDQGHKCYFSVKTGYQLTGLRTIDNAGHKCYFSVKTGYQLKGLVTTDTKGTQRYFSAKTGYLLKNGWYNIGGGRKVLINASGVVTKITKV